jgi:hypothetical protein
VLADAAARHPLAEPVSLAAAVALFRARGGRAGRRLAPAKVRQLRALLRHRASLVRLGTGLRNRIHAVAADHGHDRSASYRVRAGPRLAGRAGPARGIPGDRHRLPGGDRRPGAADQPISKQGSAWLRWVLNQAAQTARRSPDFAATCAAIARRRGKKIATIAIVRLILRF